LLYERLAAALGMGLNIQEPDGKLVIDIGGGTTEIVGISLSGIACFQSIKVAGDSMDESIRQYLREWYLCDRRKRILAGSSATPSAQTEVTC
jgi:rod shape-determining protein MreB